METAEVNTYIGEGIKNLRNRNGLTQQELADRTELTKGFISQLERGQVSPSVLTLFEIIECLGSTPAEFFRKEEEKVVFTEEEYFEKIDDLGNKTEWIIPNAQKNMMEPLRVTLKPGGSTYQYSPHEGELFGYVLSGSVTIHLGQQQYKARRGESFYFKGGVRHYIEASGKAGAVFIWVCAPPNF